MAIKYSPLGLHRTVKNHDCSYYWMAAFIARMRGFIGYTCVIYKD